MVNIKHKGDQFLLYSCSEIRDADTKKKKIVVTNTKNLHKKFVHICTCLSGGLGTNIDKDHYYTKQEENTNKKWMVSLCVEIDENANEKMNGPFMHKI